MEQFHIEDGRMSGKEIARLMRKYKVTIRELSERTGITMKRIREVREKGLQDRRAIRDWIQGIIGRDLVIQYSTSQCFFQSTPQPWENSLIP